MKLADYHLPKRLRPAVAQAARVCCPAELEELGLTEHIIDGVEMQLRAFPRGFRLAMTAGIAALEAGAAVAPRTVGRPFSRLSPEEARAWFSSWWDSPVGALRQLARGLKSLIVLMFYASPPMRERLAYHPDRWIAEVARRRLERWGAAIARHEEELVAPDPLLPASRLVPRVRHA